MPAVIRKDIVQCAHRGAAADGPQPGVDSIFEFMLQHRQIVQPALRERNRHQRCALL